MRKSIALVMLGILAIGSFALIPAFSNADTQFSSLWVKLGGFINKWGNESAFGWLRALVHTVDINGTTHESAAVHAMWTQEIRRFNFTEDPIGSFTFSYYTARLVNTSTISFNSSGYDFFVSGLWNVSEITTSLTVNMTDHLVNFTRTDVQVLSEAPGELGVPTSTPGKFGLNITGIDVLSGFLAKEIIQFKELKFFDVSGPSGSPDGKVDIYDLVKVAKSYGTVPGMKGYNFDFDFNLEGRIGIGDLTTIAANIEG